MLSILIRIVRRLVGSENNNIRPRDFAFESFGSLVVKNIPQLGCLFSILKKFDHKGHKGHKGQPLVIRGLTVPNII